MNTNTTTYTVLNSQGEVEARNLTITEAASELLGYDGYAFEIRRADSKWDVAGEPSWELWHSDGSANSTRGARHMVKTTISVYAADADAAWPLIAREVIKHPDWFKDCDMMTDAAYDEMLSEIEAE